MTRAQFAQSVDADEKWVENAAAALNLPQVGYTRKEAYRFGLIRLLSRDFAIPVTRAAILADSALLELPSEREVRLKSADNGNAILVLDLARYSSTLAARLSVALHQGGPRRPGRPASADRYRERDPIIRAADYGVDLTLLREELRLRPAERLARLDANVAFLRVLRPVHRSIPAPKTS
ncbi:MAG TPA: hypothetical protein VII66_03585 [Gemmatimonadaceae bacterium]